MAPAVQDAMQASESNLNSTPTTPQKHEVASSAWEATCMILQCTNEVSDVFPPLKAAVGGVLFIAQIVDSFKDNKEAWRELAVDIAEMIKAWYENLPDSCDLDAPKTLAPWEGKLKALTSKMEYIGNDIKLLADRPRYKRVLQAKKDSAKIDLFRKRIDSARISFLVDATIINAQAVTNIERLVKALQPTSSMMPAPLGRPDFITLTPEKPRIFHGREHELKTILSSITSGMETNTPARIVIRGSGGLGKTTLALSALHHKESHNHFGDRRHFVSCEATDTASPLLSAIQRALGLPQAEGDPLVQLKRYLNTLTSTSLLVLDNFETPWLGKEKDGVQKTLALLASCSHLTLLLTTRVNALPHGIQWTTPHQFPSLRPFSMDAAQQTFYDIAGEEANRLPDIRDNLLRHLDLVPLPVTLLAHLVHAG